MTGIYSLLTDVDGVLLVLVATISMDFFPFGFCGMAYL